MSTITVSSTLHGKERIFALLAANIDQIKAFGVKRIGLFGSFVRDEQHSGSDIDLLVDFEPELKTFQNFMGLSFFLEELLGAKVELVTRESLSPYIGPHILREVQYGDLSR